MRCCYGVAMVPPASPVITPLPVDNSAAAGDPGWRPTVQLFVNPHAGSWRRTRIARLKQAFEAAGARVLVTPSLRGRLDVADAADHVCAVGGDGTVRHVAAAVNRAGRALPMSVYPMGTVNLLARECDYPSDPDAFVRRALAIPPRRRHFTAVADDILILNCASVGPDSDTVAALSPRLKRVLGRGAYAVALCALLIRWPRRRLQVTHDGQTIDCGAVYVAKGRYFAGDWSFAPAAAVDRPLLHVVALPQATRIAFLHFAWALFRDRLPADAIRFTCTDLTINGDAAAPLQADGDIVAHLPVKIRIAEDTLIFT